MPPSAAAAVIWNNLLQTPLSFCPPLKGGEGFGEEIITKSILASMRLRGVGMEWILAMPQISSCVDTEDLDPYQVIIFVQRPCFAGLPSLILYG
ncbi:hypothetical protein CDAR_249681 [Caerostris darwini]|uniref:Uncharacterized protein n=1 Tax=Caerostris darwini TaxID=1538125 RepID=A0AAV4RJ10_9ARAC|nr:hypothetical protein CDAR_249681 [Caerostris darwini]